MYIVKSWLPVDKFTKLYFRTSKINYCNPAFVVSVEISWVSVLTVLHTV